MKAFVLAGVAALALSVQAQAANFVKFEGVDGEATDEAYKGWSNADATWVSLGQQANEAGVIAPDAPVIFYDIQLRKAVDASSTRLMQAAVDGEAFPSVTVVQTTTAGEIRYALKNVRITSFSFDPEGYENLMLNFSGVDVDVTRVDAAGKSVKSSAVSWTRK